MKIIMMNDWSIYMPAKLSFSYILRVNTFYQTKSLHHGGGIAVIISSLPLLIERHG